MGDKLLAFVQRYLGARDTGTNTVNRGQCVGLVEVWLAAEGKGPIWGNAADLLKNASASLYKVALNGPSNYPPPGAVVCWDTTWGGGYGHTAVVLSATRDLLVVFEQNNPAGEAPVVNTHDYTGVAGWITVK